MSGDNPDKTLKAFLVAASSAGLLGVIATEFCVRWLKTQAATAPGVLYWFLGTVCATAFLGAHSLEGVVRRGAMTPSMPAPAHAGSAGPKAPEPIRAGRVEGSPGLALAAASWPQPLYGHGGVGT